MSEFSRGFSFDDFDELCRDALEEHYSKDLEMLEQSEQWVEQLRWQDTDEPDYDDAA